ncbi:MAG: hypothetical protein IT532_06735 [Burkholderiales bacterium]|nr:hypothetical protein [Burkholderiales bacterium]
MSSAILPASARRRSNLPRWAALLALVLLVVIWGGMLLRESLPNGQTLLGQAVGSTGAAFLTPLALICAVGLWLRTAWGWWVSVIVFAWQGVSYALFLMVVLASGDVTGILTWLTGAILVVLVVLLLLPPTRNACLQR